MKKFYSLILLVVLGPLFSFGQAPFTQKSKVSAVSTSVKAVAAKNAMQKLSVNNNLSAAKHVQPGNQVQYVFSDNFDLPSDTDALAARGYHTYYRGGGAQAAATWFTGNPSVFAAHSGASDSYVAANYQVVSGTNDIDSWLVLPAFNLTTSDIISFWCTSPTGSTFPDSVKVMYSAAGDSVPEAATWVLVDDFQASTTGWEQKTYNVPTASATGRFAIRYAVVDGGPNGANSNYIGIDDLNVGQLPADDVAMVPANIGPYVIVPLAQAQPVQLEAQVTNAGGATETNVGFDASVYLSQDFGATFTQVYNGLSAAEPSLAAGATSGVLSAGSFTFTDTGLYAFQYITYMDNADLDSTNDILTNFIYIDDTSYAKDDIFFGGTAQAYGAPAGSTVSFGNIYDINTAATIKSVTIYHAFATLGGTIRADIYDVLGGAPNAIIGSSAPYVYTADDTSSQFLLELTIPLSTPLAVPTGPVFVAIAQVDPSGTNGEYNMGLALTSNIFTAGTTYIQLDSDPFDVSENFGLSGAWAVRPNFDLSDGIAQPEIANGISVYPNPSNGKVYIHNNGQKENMTVTVFNNLGQTVYSGTYSQMSTAVVDLSKEAAGVYSVQIKSAKEITTKSVVISNN